MMRCILQLLVCALAVSGAVAVCPTVCSCFAGPGVDCSHRILANVPAGIPNASLTVRLHSNYLTSIPATTFKGFAQLQLLTLGYNQLTILPDGIFADLKHLTRLFLSNNKIFSLPPTIFNSLINLNDLNLASNKLTALPPGVFDQMANLEILQLQANQLSSLPTGIFANNRKLKFLRLHTNHLSVLSAGLFEGLLYLDRLELHTNLLTSLPTGIFNDLRILQALSLYNNALASLPVSVFDNLTILQAVSLHNNSLLALLPGVFDQLKVLTYLTMSLNRLTELPPLLFDQLTKLATLDVRENPFLLNSSICALRPIIGNPSFQVDTNISQMISQAFNAVACGVSSKLCYAFSGQNQHPFCECPLQGQLYDGQQCQTHTTLCSGSLAGSCDPQCYKRTNTYLCQCAFGRVFDGYGCVQSNITLERVSATSASISWPQSTTFGYDGAAFPNANQKVIVQPLHLPNHTQTSTIQFNETQTQQTSLCPETYYRVTVGNAEFRPLYFSTATAGLTDKSTLQTAVASSSTSVTVSWLRPTLLDTSEILLGYQVLYKVSGTPFSQSIDIPSSSLSQSIDGLRSFTSYAFMIRTQTRLGFGPFGNQLSATTLEAVPSVAPNVSFLQAVSSSSILVSWNSIPQDQANGQLLVYEVRVQGGGSTSAQNASAIQNTVIISGLQPNSAYMVDIRAFTAAGPGVYSRQAGVTMTTAAMLSSSSSSTTVIIVGAALGMVVLIILLLAVVFLVQWRRSKKNLTTASRSSGSVRMTKPAASDDIYQAVPEFPGLISLPPIPPHRNLLPTSARTKPRKEDDVHGDSPPPAGKLVSKSSSRTSDTTPVQMIVNQAYGKTISEDGPSILFQQPEPEVLY